MGEEGQDAAGLPEQGQEAPAPEGGGNGAGRDIGAGLLPEDGGQPPDGGGQLQGEKDKEPPTQGAPEEYEPFSLPEGVAAGSEVQAAFAETARKMGLSQEAAQEMTDKLSGAVYKSVVDHAANMSMQWAEQTRKDTEIGGDRLEKSLALANRAFDAFASERLREDVKKSGLGAHPEFIRFLAKVGEAVSPDGFVSGRNKPAEKDILQRLYPNESKEA